MKTKLILADVDGTLLNSRGQVDPETVEAIAAARKQGALFGLSTGRELQSVLEALKEWGIDGLVDVIIASGGGQAADLTLNRSVKNYPLEGSLIHEVMNHYKDLDVNFVVPENGLLYAPKDDVHIRELSRVDHIPYKVVDFDEFLREPRQKVMLTFREETMKAVQERSKTFSSPLFKGVPLVTAAILFEYMDPRISKTYGIQKILDWHGWTMDEVCSFGDQDNDIDMLTNSGIGVCMENGSEGSRQAADFITGSNDENGIASFLNEYILNDRWFEETSRH